MRTLILLFTCLLFSINSFSQNLTYKNLIGTWILKDDFFDKKKTNDYTQGTLKFIDSTHILWVETWIKKTTNYDSTYLSYTLDTLTTPNLLHMEGVSNNGYKMDMYYLVKIKDDNTLKIQGSVVGVKPKKWIRRENGDNSFLLIKQ